YIYGTILGVFVVAFYLKRIRGTSVFIAAVFTELIIILIGQGQESDSFIVFLLGHKNSLIVFLTDHKIAYLWLNAIGCFLVIIIAGLLNILLPGNKKSAIAK